MEFNTKSGEKSEQGEAGAKIINVGELLSYRLRVKDGRKRRGIRSEDNPGDIHPGEVVWAKQNLWDMGRVMAIINNLVIGLLNSQGYENHARARRVFDASPGKALALIC